MQKNSTKKGQGKQNKAKENHVQRTTIKNVLYCIVLYLGYEPADLTVHPPPIMIEGGLIFFVWVSSATKIFS